MFLAPYTGITDFTSFEQVKEMLAIFKKNLSRGSKRLLHVGVMMSHKTLLGIETKWSKAFPANEAIAGIFRSTDAHIYKCLHYADYYYDPDLWRNLTKAISYGGVGIHAIQLDMIWPDPGQIASGVHTSRKRIEVILQIGKNAIETANNDYRSVVRRLEDYEEVIDRVLLDKSMGRGIGMDAYDLLPFVRAIKDRFPDLGIGVAGGLGPETMHLVEPLVAEFPDLSIDAQGKLRPSGNALDPVDWNMAADYLVKAANLFN